jgi:hypothetical protein
MQRIGEQMNKLVLAFCLIVLATVVFSSVVEALEYHYSPSYTNGVQISFTTTFPLSFTDTYSNGPIEFNFKDSQGKFIKIAVYDDYLPGSLEGWKGNIDYFFSKRGIDSQYITYSRENLGNRQAYTGRGGDWIIGALLSNSDPDVLIYAQNNDRYNEITHSLHIFGAQRESL